LAEAEREHEATRHAAQDGRPRVLSHAEVISERWRRTRLKGSIAARETNPTLSGPFAPPAIPQPPDLGAGVAGRGGEGARGGGSLGHESLTTLGAMHPARERDHVKAGFGNKIIFRRERTPSTNSLEGNGVGLGTAAVRRPSR
jgi:hypothetical protein